MIHAVLLIFLHFLMRMVIHRMWKIMYCEKIFDCYFRSLLQIDPSLLPNMEVNHT